MIVLSKRYVMTNRERPADRVELAIEGIGGIDSTTVTLDRGVNILEGRNATNRTSFLQAIMAGLGSENVSLKGDRDEGSVELSIGGETYTRTIHRENGSVLYDGEPYLSETTEAELFAFLLESNEARQAVSSGADLRDVIMRPIDTGEIETQIRDLQAEREAIDERIGTLERRRRRLPDLSEREADVEADLADERETLADLRAELDSLDVDVETRQAEKEQLEATLADLSDTRNDLENLRFRLETEREALDSAREELAETEATLADLPETPSERLAGVEDRIAELRERKRTYDTRVSKLHRIVQFNEEMLGGESVVGDLVGESNGALTDDLVGETETTCWTCGSSVAAGEIEEMLASLQELSQSQRRERTEVEAELDELTNERDRLGEVRRRREDLSAQVADLEAEIDRREGAIAELETEEAELRDRVADLEAEAEQLEGVADSQVLDLHKRVNEQEVTVERLADDLEDVHEEIERLEGMADEIDELDRKRDQITEQLTELRTRIDRLEVEAVEAFNEHMAELVDLLGYDNLARVWIDRRTEAGGADREGETTFDLHVVRTTDEGVTYEDTIDHLSESEREVVGLVFALAGYLVHEVYETVPFMLLDSLEAIDSERIALLVDYLTEYSPTIVAALLPEDAQALDDSYTRIEEI